MKNLFKRTDLWAIASLFAAMPLFAMAAKHAPEAENCCDPCKPCEPCTEVCPLPVPDIAAYNAPGRVDVNCPWNVFASVSFLYWQPVEENLELGIISTSSSAYGPVINMSFDFEPGFKIALGFLSGYDNWDVSAEYTRLHGKSSTSASVADPVTPTNGINAAALLPELSNDYIFGSANQTWQLDLDFLDFSLGRNFYVGTKLLFTPFVGIRAAWIKQNLDDSFDRGISITFPDDSSANATSNQNTHSWALGLRGGVNTDWLIGAGFRLIGNASADLLYTRYTQLQATNTLNADVEDVPPTTTIMIHQKNAGYLRGHLEMDLGTGWGAYFYRNKYHFDLAATYGFQVFFSQNMFRQFCDTQARGSSFAPNGNLYINGLNLTARFDF